MGDAAAFVTTGNGRMVYAKATRPPVEIWRMPARGGADKSRAATKLIASSQDERNPAYSPDGRRIAFVSTRSGARNICVSTADGANPVQLTAFDADADWFRWSPDGRRIVFEALESGNDDIYVVDAEGGMAQRLTREASSDKLPTFSRDGRFIYFSSDRSGRREIWRMPADGGPAVQRWLLKARHGEARIHFLDFSSGRVSELLRHEGPFSPGAIDISPDDKWILEARTFTVESELMLVENFR